MTVKIDGKAALVHGAISFKGIGGRPYNVFVIGAIREFDPAPAADIRIDNVILDYR